MPMQDFAQQRATYEDVLAAPPDVVAELFDGVLYTMGCPRPRQTHAASKLGIILGNPFGRGVGGPGGWWIEFEPELHLGEDVAVPDIAGWRLARMPELPETAWFGTAPDWVCEVLSHSTEGYDRGLKRLAYARHGIAHLWFINPDERFLEVFELDRGAWRLTHTLRDGDEVMVAPFSAAPFSLAELWAKPRVG